MSPGRFKAILRYQLGVTEDVLWQTLATRRAVDRHQT